MADELEGKMLVTANGVYYIWDELDKAEKDEILGQIWPVTDYPQRIKLAKSLVWYKTEHGIWHSAWSFAWYW